MTINVLKSNGNLEPLNLNKIIQWSEWAAKDCPDISLEAILSTLALHEGISTQDITIAICQKCEESSIIEANQGNHSLAEQYFKVSRNLYTPNLLKRCNLTYQKYLTDNDIYTYGYKLSEDNIVPLNRYKIKSILKAGIDLGIYNPELLDGTLAESIFDYADSLLDYTDMHRYFYNGLRQTEEKYLIKYNNKKLFEDPIIQKALMALQYVRADAPVFKDGKDKLFQYTSFADYFLTATHSKSNDPSPFSTYIRTNHKQYDSCCLIEIDDTADSINMGAYTMYTATTQGAGIGLNSGAIRAKGSLFKQRGVHSGMFGYLNYGSTAIKSSSQVSRGGSATVTTPLWHRDVYTHMMLKDATSGAEGENRLRHLDYTFGYNGYLLEKYETNGKILLASPHTLLPSGKKLYEAYYNVDENGFYDDSEFVEYCESRLLDPDLPQINKHNVESIKPGVECFTYAQDLWNLFTEQQSSTNRLYNFVVDHVNNHSPFIEPIRMSNLCVAPETLLLTDKGQIPISELKNQEVNIWNGEEWSTTVVRQTGVNQKLLKVNTSTELSLECTPYHKWYVLEDSEKISYKEVRTHELKVGDKLIKFNKPFSENNTVQNDEFVTVTSVEDLGRTDDTYCVTEPKRHMAVFNGILTGQCLEILQPTKAIQLTYNSKDNTYTPNDGEVSFCQLGAIVLGSNNTKYEEIEDVCYTILRKQEAVFNISDYSKIPFSHKQKRRRNVGIGIANGQRLLVEEVYTKFPKDQWIKEAGKVTHKYMEAIQYYLIKASVRLAKELGPCEDFHLTKYSKGILPIDTCTNTELNSHLLLLDWESLRADVLKYGMRNSCLTAMMPIESSSVEMSLVPFFEFPRKLVTYKGNKKLTVAVPVPDLAKYGEYYITAWDKSGIDKNDLYLSICSNVNKFLDQGISYNSYFDLNDYPDRKIPSYVYMQKVFINPYREGIKTGYYVNINTQEDDKENDENIVKQLKQQAEKEAEAESCSGGSCKL